MPLAPRCLTRGSGGSAAKNPPAVAQRASRFVCRDNGGGIHTERPAVQEEGRERETQSQSLPVWQRSFGGDGRWRRWVLPPTLADRISSLSSQSVYDSSLRDPGLSSLKETGSSEPYAARLEQAAKRSKAESDGGYVGTARAVMGLVSRTLSVDLGSDVVKSGGGRASVSALWQRRSKSREQSRG